MNIFTRYIAPGLLIASVLSGWAGVAFAQTSQRTETAGKELTAGQLTGVNRLLQAYVDKGRIAGGVVQIHQDGRPVLTTAVGWRDKEAKDPMRNDTLFRIASQTKALTSVAILMLMEEGKLTLSDPLSKYLPGWSSTTVAVEKPGGGYDVVPAHRPITLHDLLTHTSGVSYGNGPAVKVWRDAGFLGWYWGDRHETIASAVSRMPRLPMAGQPGEQWIYGYSTDILGVVVEKVSGQTLQAFLTERLIRPLALKDTFFYVPANKANRLAVVYSETAEGRIRRAPDPGEWQDGNYVGQGEYIDGAHQAYSGGAGLLSTAADYSRFLEMIRRGGELDGKRYLRQQTVKQMVSNQIEGVPYPPGMGFGLGFNIRTDAAKAGDPGETGEFAWSGIYHSLYWVDPHNRMTVVYMVQLLPAEHIDDWARLRSVIYQALK